MNYMKQIAEMLGVELGEEFRMQDHGKDVFSVRISENNVFFIDEDGLFEGHKNYFSHLRNEVLTKLLQGKASIVHLPWKPKSGEKVYYVSVDGTVIDICFTSSYARHLSLYKLGKFYRTREEAEAHAEEDKAYWDEVRKELEK